MSLPDLAVADVACDGGHPGWSDEEPVSRFTVVLVQAGCIRRRVDGRDIVADVTAGYIETPGSVQRIDHPAGGDVCTVIAPGPSFVDSAVWDRRNPPERLTIPMDVDLAHRVLVGRARRGADVFELAERAAALLDQVLEVSGGQRRPIAEHKRAARLVDIAREALANRSGVQLTELAAIAGVSASYLSRVFRVTTGRTLTRYRRALRVRHAIQRLAEGESDVAALAVDLGFADQAHLTRSLRREGETTPGRVRRVMEAREPIASSTAYGGHGGTSVLSRGAT